MFFFFFYSVARPNFWCDFFPIKKTFDIYFIYESLIIHINIHQAFGNNNGNSLKYGADKICLFIKLYRTILNLLLISWHSVLMIFFFFFACNIAKA